MFASFNYQDPSAVIMAIGIVLGLAILFGLAFTRSALAGFLGGATTWCIIAIAVFGCGKGDMTGAVQMVCGVFYGVLGAILGLIAGFIGKIYFAARPQPPAPAQSKSP